MPMISANNTSPINTKPWQRSIHKLTFRMALFPTPRTHSWLSPNPRPHQLDLLPPPSLRISKSSTSTSTPYSSTITWSRLATFFDFHLSFLHSSNLLQLSTSLTNIARNIICHHFFAPSYPAQLQLLPRHHRTSTLNFFKHHHFTT